jgi:hypothetical protein
MVSAFAVVRRSFLISALGGLSLIACAPDNLGQSEQGSFGSGSGIQTVDAGTGTGSGSGSGTIGGSDGGTGTGSGSGSGGFQDPYVWEPTLQESAMVDGYAGGCIVRTYYYYSGESASGYVTITSADLMHSVMMPFNGNGEPQSFGFSFGAAGGQWNAGADTWYGDDTPNDNNYAWLAQCGDDYTPMVQTQTSTTNNDLMADCTRFRDRYNGSLENRDRAAGRANTDIAISLGAAALAATPARFLRWGAFGVKGTRIGLGAASGAGAFMADRNSNTAGGFASAANAHCEGWQDCCAQPGGPHTTCPANCRTNHGSGRGS